MYGIDSYYLGVEDNSFHQPQFDPNSSWVDFFEKVFMYVKERLFLKWYKGRKRFFLSHLIWSKSVSNNFSEKVFAKIKSLWFLSFGCKKQFFPSACLSSVSSTNPSAQSSKLENNALDNTSLLLMNRRYNLLFYSQYSCAIARFLFSNISVFFPLAFSM